MNYYLILGLGLGWAEQQSKQSEICYDKVSIMFKISFSATVLSYINLSDCHKLHSACIFTTSGLILTN